jgi:hypothetical protein
MIYLFHSLDELLKEQDKLSTMLGNVVDKAGRSERRPAGLISYSLISYSRKSNQAADPGSFPP